MRQILGILSLAMILGIASGCSSRLRPFTQELYDRAGWTEEDLRHIQFYLSEDIVLTRRINAGESVIADGKIKIVDGRRVEQVRIPANTPGVLLFAPKRDRFAVSFEKGDDDLFLMFGPNPKIDNRYALLAREWERNRGKVQYNGKLWDVSADSAFSTLLVDVRKVGQTEYNTRRAEGRRVD